MSSNTVIIIGISGASASGKSLLSNNILHTLGSDQVVVISEDAYYNDLSEMTIEERNQVNFDHPQSLDHQLLHQHLIALQQGKSIEAPCYDYTTHQRTPKTLAIGNHRILVIEGILLFVEAYLRDIMDIKIFMDTPLDICLLRRITRDVTERGRTLEGVMEQYQKTVRPMYLQFVEPSKRYADVIVPRGGENRIAIDMIQAKMRELLTQ